MKGLLFAIVTAALSGCLADDPQRPEDVPSRLDHEAGAGDTPVSIRVESLSGGADEVSLQWIDDDGSALQVRPRDGVGTFHTDGHPGLLVAGSPTQATECVRAEPVDQTITVYPRSGGGEIDASIALAAHAGVLGPTWFPHPTLVGPPGGWADRLSRMELELTWENGAGGGGDLGIAVGDETFYYWNGAYQATPGTHTETLQLGPEEIRMALAGASVVRIGPSVSTGHLSLDVPYSLRMTYEVDATPTWAAGCAEALGHSP